jgi:ketosteroid isomerase-like protein
MGVAENRAVALTMIEKLSKGVIDDDIVTADVTWWIPGIGTVARPAFEALANGFRSHLVDEVAMTVHGITAEGDLVAVEAEAHADLKNGRHYNNTYHFLFQFRDGKIFHAKEYNNSAHVAEVFGSGGPNAAK